MNPYPALFSSIRIGQLRFKNRICAAPTQIRQKDPLGHMNDFGIAYFEAKARGGAAMVTIGDTPVESLYGATQFNSFQLDDPGALSSLSQVASAISQYGSIPSLELSHGGAISSPAFNGGNSPIGPSAFTKPDGTQVLQMDEELIAYITEKYASGARTIQKAGFPMCTVHGGHGWLLSQFLSPRSNHRQDFYGGSLENRARLSLEVLDAIRKACGRNFLIEFRISGDEFVSDGFHLEDMLEFSRMLVGKADLIHVSAGVHGIPDGLMRMFPSNLTPHGLNVYLATEIKKASGLPISTVGAISDPEQAEEIITSGQADFVALGRALIADPDFPNKARKGIPIRPCLRCLNCLGSMNVRRHLQCAVNPTVGIEHRFQEPPLPIQSKRVLVVGGGPAGMTAAATAASRGHRVLLCEKTDQLGGLLIHADTDPNKKDLRRFKKYLIDDVKSSGAEIRLNTFVDKAVISEFHPDVIVCAVGSSPVLPPIPGIDAPYVVNALDAHAPDARIGNEVVVIGGGLVGCETALFLSETGKQVTVVEMASSLAPEDVPLHRMALMKRLTPKIKVLTSHTCIGISDHAVELRTPEESIIRISADTIIISAGMKANTDAVDAMENCAEEFYPVGDCNQARKIHDAVSEGYYAALYL